MKVFKFGGASVSSIERIQHIAELLQTMRHEKLVIVISAMGKTTNALEKVAEAFYNDNAAEALQLFELVKQQHLNTAKFLLVTRYNQTLEELVAYFTEVEWLLHDKPVRGFDYYYDQIVCIGELLSTCIMNAFLNEKGITNALIDVRDLLRTDDNFRDAGIDWAVSTNNISRYFETHTDHNIFITQGFIGCTDANESTTLGREGSDYTAAIFANILDAESLTIWKDVEGVMSADPREFADAQYLGELSYSEVIEMAYYGAQVIHPKTIKPLQNKQIPLFVKSFIDPSLPGTTISKKNAKLLPAIKIIKRSQVLINLRSHDFSFVGGKPINSLYQILSDLHITPNLLQTRAIGIQLCLDDHAEKIDQLAQHASALFDVQIEKDLSLLTIRHFNEALLSEMTNGKNVALLQQTRDTVQVVFR